MSALSQIELYAGIGPNGQGVVERLQVRVNEQNECQLVRSPGFVKGIASGDVIKLDGTAGHFELVRRSGNLAIRVISRESLSAIAENLTPALELMGGELDSETPRMLVYSIHVSCGFAVIEELLTASMDANSTWFYGNVYAPEDGVTPLNWWLELLEQV